MNVQVGIESRQNSMKSLPADAGGNPLLGDKQPIKEYPSEYEETDQHEDLIQKNRRPDPKKRDNNRHPDSTPTNNRHPDRSKPDNTQGDKPGERDSLHR